MGVINEDDKSTKIYNMVDEMGLMTAIKFFGSYDNIVDMYGGSINLTKEKKIDLILKHTAEEKVFVYADRQRIRQVITNLITNSIRYGKEGGETKIRYNDTGVKVIAEVADTGIGIPDKFLPRIFERFYRVDKGRSREQGGTGLGLAIVKHIVEAHRQTIGVMSTEGVGSVFTFTLQKS